MANMLKILGLLCLLLCLLQSSAAPIAIGADLEIEQNQAVQISLNATFDSCSETCLEATFYITVLPTTGELFNVFRSSSGSIPGAKITETPSAVRDRNLVYFVPTTNTFGTPDPEFWWYAHHNGESSNSARVHIAVGQDADPPFVGGAGDALLFDGYDDYAIARMDTFPVEQGTIMLWMKSARARAKQTVFSVFSGGNRIIELTDVMDLQLFWGSDSASVRRSIDVSDGGWHHIAVTWQDGGDVSIIVDAQTLHSEPLGVSLFMADEVELVLGQRLVCAGTSERERKMREAKAKFEANTNTSAAGDCAPALGVCVVDEPTAGCDIYVENQLAETVLHWMDANDVLQRHSDPEAPAVQPGPWTCTFNSRLCVHGRAAVMEAFACSCTAGCLEPTFAYSGFLDEVRMYAFAKTDSQLLLDMNYVIPPRASGISIGRTPQHWMGLFLQWTMEAEGGLAEPATVGTMTTPTLYLGGEQDHLSPQRIGSTAPLIGAHQSTEEAFDGKTVTMIKLHMHSAATAITVLRARVLEPIPLFGALYTADFNPRAGFSVGEPILLGLTILPPAWEVAEPYGTETCVQGDCTRDGYYVFYVPQQVAAVSTDVLNLEASSSPFLDDTGAPIPVIAVQSSVRIKSIQLPIAVSWTEEIHENTPKVVYLPVISLSDRSFTAQIEAPPTTISNMTDGGLYHVFEVSCDVEQMLADPVATGCSDVGAVHPYCEDEQYTDLQVESEDGTEHWHFKQLELQVRFVFCTDLTRYNGKPIVRGFNDTAELCSSFINKTTQCVFHLNATCACPHPNRCLEPFITPYQKQLADYRLKPNPTYTALAALTGNFYLLEWLLGLGSSVPPITMEIAAASGNSAMVDLLLAARAPWTKHAIVAANKRMHTAVATTLLRASSDRASGYFEPPAPADGRCFVRGPRMETSLPFPTFFRVNDPEFRLIYVPPPFESGNNIPFIYSVTRAGSFQEITSFSATGTMQVIPARSPALVEPLAVEVGAGQRIVFLRLAVNNPDGGQARARVVSFPQKGRLFNLLSEGGGVSSTPSMLGGEIPSADSLISQLPIAIVNATDSGSDASSANGTGSDHDLYELPPGPWRGHLNLPRVGTCHCAITAVRAAAASTPTFNATQERCEPRGTFEATCGELGSHAVMLRYQRKVFPTKVTIMSWMPRSTRLRVLARMPEQLEQVWTPVAERQRRRWRTEAHAKQFAQERAEDGATVDPPRVAAVVGGCAGVFTELWSGTALDALVDDGVLKPPIPALFATDTLYIQVCGLLGRGIGAEDGGSVLEGMKAVELSGSYGGEPRGLVQHPDNWVAYWRDDAAPDAEDAGGTDTFTYGGFEPFGEDGKHRDEDTAAVTMTLPPQWTPPLATWRHLVVAEGANATIETATTTARVLLFSQLPVNGTLRVAGADLETATPSNVRCASEAREGVAVQLEASQALEFVATSPGAQKEYAAMRYVECLDAKGFSSTRAVQVSVWCGLNHRLDNTLQRCVACPQGMWAPAFSGAERCTPCPPGSTTRRAGVQGTTSSIRIEGTECWACGLGSAAPRPGSASCALCQLGTFSNESGSQTCQECPLGTFGAVVGASQCKECGASSFAPMRGLPECIRCPQNTITRSMTSHSLAQCECSSESYHKTAMQGQECSECPEGGHCPGGVLAPVARTGYWTDRTIWRDETTVRMAMCNYRGVRGVCIGYPDVLLQTTMQRCLYQQVPGICDNWPDDVGGLPGDAAGGIVDIAFGSHLMERARSASPFNESLLSFYGKTRLVVDAAHCREGYKGRFCSDCNSTHYRRFDGYCAKCPVWGNFITYIAWFAVFTALSGMLVSVALSDGHAALILVCFFQSLHLVSEFQLNWPPTLMYLLRASGLSNINLHMLPWKCFGIALAWLDVWFLSLFGPVILVLVSSTLWLLPWIVTTKYYFAARNYVLRGRVWMQEQFHRYKEKYREARRQQKLQAQSTAAQGETSAAHSETAGNTAARPPTVVGSRFGDGQQEGSDEVRPARPQADEIALVGPEAESGSERREQGEEVSDEVKNQGGLAEGGALGEEHAVEQQGFFASVMDLVARVSAKVGGIARRKPTGANGREDESDEALAVEAVDAESPPGASGIVDAPSSAAEIAEANDAGDGSEVGGERRAKSSGEEDSDDAADHARKRSAVARTASDATEGDAASSRTGTATEGEGWQDAGSEDDLQTARTAGDGAQSSAEEQSDSQMPEGGAKKQKKRKKRRKVKSTAALSAQHLRQQCFDTAFCNVLGLLSFFLVQSTARFLEIFTCDYWNPDMSTLSAFPEMTCGALEFSTDSVSDTAQTVSDQAIAGAEIAQDAGQRPVGGMSMAVLLYLPHLFIVLVGGNLHIAFRLRKSGKSLVDVGHRFSWRYKYLVGPFESGCWWWNIVVSVRKLVVAFSQTAMRGQPHLQIFFTSLAVSLNMLGTVMLRPYKLERCNVLEVVSLLTLLVIILIGAMNPLDITLVDQDLAMENDRTMTLTCIAVLFVFVCFAVWVLLRDVKLRQPGPPKWFRLLRLPAKIVFQILARVTDVLLAITTLLARCVRRKQVHAEDDGQSADKVRGPPWTRHKFAVRRQLYSLERTLKDECERRWSPSWCKCEHPVELVATLTKLFRPRIMISPIEVGIKDALDRSMDLLRAEYKQVFEKLYDDETILACLTEEVAEERETLRQQQEELKALQTRNSLLEAKLEIQVRRQDVPAHIRKMREETAAALRKMEFDVVDKEDELYELEMKLLETLDP